VEATQQRSLPEEDSAAPCLPIGTELVVVQEQEGERETEVEPPDEVAQNIVATPVTELPESHEPPVALPEEPRRTRYLGATLYYPALGGTGAT